MGRRVFDGASFFQNLMTREEILRNTCTLDIESYSACDLLECGAHRYAEDPTTEIIAVNYCFEDGPVKAWEPIFGHPIPADLDAVLDNPAILKIAHNAPFEIAVMRKKLGKKLNPRQWRCTMVMAHGMALPGNLDMVGQILGVDKSRGEVKSIGKKLIKFFCVPQKDGTRNLPRDDLDKWFSFMGYNEDDTAECREVYVELMKHPLRDQDWRDWCLDQKINDRGLPLDIDLIEACLDIDKRVRAKLMDRAHVLTGLANPNSRDQVLEWLQSEGEEIDNLRKETVRDALKDAPGGAVEEVLEIRRSLSKTSVKKFSKMKSARCADGRLKGSYQFLGAGRTGRWAGRLVQTQNLYKNSFEDVDFAAALAKTRDTEMIDLLFGDPMWMIAGCTRPAIAAPDSKFLLPIDYASIETIVLAWLAGCDTILNAFRLGRDPYKEFGTHLFNLPYEAITKKQRNFCKPPTLGCGYYLGAPGLVKYSEQYAVEMTEEQAKHAVDTYRRVYYQIPQYWKVLDHAVRSTIETGEPVEVRGNLKFTRSPDKMWLFIYLPSGRRLAYYTPELRPARDQKRFPGKVSVTYVGLDTYTKQWCRIETHPGKITENIVQAVARDILMFGLHLVDVSGYEIAGHTHDEIITVVSQDRAPGDLKKLEAMMSNTPPWCRDMPLRGAGWYGKHYKKD